MGKVYNLGLFGPNKAGKTLPLEQKKAEPVTAPVPAAPIEVKVTEKKKTGPKPKK